MIKIAEDRFGGVTIDNTFLPQKKDEFREEVKRIIESLPGKKLIWIKISLEKSDFIPILTNLGFEFHHCDEKNLMLIKKMADESIVPATKNFIVGVGAIVITSGQLLVVKERSSTAYKLPGGHIDKNELLKDALKREVHEETGVHIEFESIMNIGHFRNGQFGEANLYIVCTAKALSREIYIHDVSEITDARWMDTEEFVMSDDTNNYNKSVVKAAINNKELKLTEQHIKLRVSDGEVFF